jgi:molecular chaperone DnaK
VVYETEKNLREIGGKLDAAARSRLESEVESLKAAIKSEDEERIRTAVDAVSRAWHEASAKLYADAQRAGAGPTGGAGPSGHGDAGGATGGRPAEGGDADRGGKVVDADFEVVDDK